MDRDLCCALLEALVAKHRYGQPITRSELLRITSYESHRGGDAKQAFETLRMYPFITNQGQRGIIQNQGGYHGL